MKEDKPLWISRAELVLLETALELGLAIGEPPGSVPYELFVFLVEQFMHGPPPRVIRDLHRLGVACDAPSSTSRRVALPRISQMRYRLGGHEPAPLPNGAVPRLAAHWKVGVREFRFEHMLAGPRAARFARAGSDDIEGTADVSPPRPRPQVRLPRRRNKPAERRRLQALCDHEFVERMLGGTTRLALPFSLSRAILSRHGFDAKTTGAYWKMRGFMDSRRVRTTSWGRGVSHAWSVSAYALELIVAAGITPSITPAEARALIDRHIGAERTRSPVSIHSSHDPA